MYNKQILNQIIEKINDAAEADESILFTADEVKILAEEIGDIHFVPILTNERIVQLCKDGKLGQPIESW